LVLEERRREDVHHGGDEPKLSIRSYPDKKPTCQNTKNKSHKVQKTSTKITTENPKNTANPKAFKQKTVGGGSQENGGAKSRRLLKLRKN